MNIAIILYNGFDNLDAIGPFEVFNHARTSGADVKVGLYTLTRQEVVTSSHGLRIQPDGVLPSNPDLVVVPGGGWGNRAKKGAWAEAERGDLPEALARMHADGITIASVCTGGMLLAKAGITNGRPAVTHQCALDDLQESGSRVVDARVVDDGDIVTAGGITSGIDLALHFIEREISRDVATQVAATMEYNPHGEVYER